MKRLQYEYKPVHLLKDGGEQNKPEYRTLNPQGEVPTLVHDGKIIGQSLAILSYLDDIQPHPRLFPADPFMKAKVWQFCEVINSFMHPLANLKVLQKLERDHQFSQEQKTQWIQYWNNQGFKALETLLKEHSGQYSFGDKVTAADVVLVPCVFTAQRFQVDLTSFPLVRKINEECLKLDTFRKAHPGLQPDTPEAERIQI